MTAAKVPKGLFILSESESNSASKWPDEFIFHSDKKQHNDLACPYEIFKCTKCVKFLFVPVLLDFRKRTKKRFRKSVGNFLRYEFFCI